MLNITKVIDQWSWAYDFVGRDMNKYSQCKVICQKYNDITYDKQDIFIISSPNISYSESAMKIPQECKKRGIKVIGQYSGECDIIYSHADLIVTISPQLYLYSKNKYPNIPVIFLPESIDTNYFKPTEHEERKFVIGFAGGAHKAIKRTRLFSKLKYPVKIQSQHGQEFFIKGRNQDNMLDFYKSIDCLINLSETECLSRATLEAMASGLPIISTDTGGIHLLIPDEYIVPIIPEELCVEEVNKLLDLLISDFALHDGLGKINRAWCEKCWSWEANMPIWDEVFYYLSKGNINKILEIGENVISPFKKYFEMNEAYEKQIAKFSRLKMEYTPKIVHNPNDHVIANLIDDMHKTNIIHWMSRESCLDTINHQRIVHKHDQLYIGVKNFADKNNLLNYLVKCGGEILNEIVLIKGVNVHINIENIQSVKTMVLYGKAVSVPYPVVSYLMQKFGKDWEKK